MEQETHKVRKSLDECKSHLARSCSDRRKLEHDSSQLRSERDRLIMECNLIMSERTDVHKEIEQLQVRFYFCDYW